MLTNSLKTTILVFSLLLSLGQSGGAVGNSWQTTSLSEFAAELKYADDPHLGRWTNLENRLDTLHEQWSATTGDVSHDNAAKRSSMR